MEITGPPSYNSSRYSSGASGTRQQRSAGSSSDGSGASAAETAALQAERDRLAQIASETTQLERQGQGELDHLRQDYSTQATQESSRDEGALESQRLKGYDNIRQVQRAQAAELARVRREGDAELAKLREYYKDEIHHTGSRGDSQLDDLRRHNADAVHEELKTDHDQFERVEAERDQKLALLQGDRDRQVEGATKQYHRELDELSGSQTLAHEQARKRYEEVRRSTLEQHRHELDRLQTDSARKLGELRESTARKLDAYQERQADPFYKLVDLGATLSEGDGAYVLRMRVPDHEEPRIQVSVQGDRVVMNGTRRSDERLESEPGHRRTTSAYQAYSETFPIDWPVETREITRSYDGGVLTVILPKRRRPSAPPHQANHPARAIVDRPQFPENLPHTSQAELPPASRGPTDPPVAPAPRSPGSDTLG